VIQRFITGLSIGAAVTGVCYALATATAMHLAGSVASESVRSGRMDSSGAAKPGDPRWKAIRDWTAAGRAARAS
jgi:hypothetical protein